MWRQGTFVWKELFVWTVPGYYCRMWCISTVHLQTSHLITDFSVVVEMWTFQTQPLSAFIGLAFVGPLRSSIGHHGFEEEIPRVGTGIRIEAGQIVPACGREVWAHGVDPLGQSATNYCCDQSQRWDPSAPNLCRHAFCFTIEDGRGQSQGPEG